LIKTAPTCFGVFYTIIRGCINAIPDDGVKYTETCRSSFNVNFNIFLRQLTSASVGE